jgi:heme-degrading monooxygenase HmoA
VATTTLIELFEVPVAAEEEFLAAWPGGGVLHRALREDADFRFAALGRDDPAATPFRSHAAWYEVTHEDGAPAGAEGVVLINAFEVPPDGDEAFLIGWDAAREYLAARPGYQGTRLHRSLEPAADFRFVNVARWSSPLAFSKAVGSQAFREGVGAVPFASHPALYLLVPG